LTHNYRIGETDPNQPLLLSFTHWYTAQGCTNMNIYSCMHNFAGCFSLLIEPVATADLTSFSVYTVDPAFH